jgi:hypothetical protein
VFWIHLPGDAGLARCDDSIALILIAESALHVIKLAIHLGNPGLILATSGHGDDQGQAVDIAANTGATIFAPGELAGWMAGKVVELGGSKGQVYGGAISGRYKLGDITVQTLQALHGTGVSADNYRYGGFAAGFLITFENGLKVLMAGSTGLTLDLQLFGMRY